jgi:hypothetical protein
MLKSAAIYFVAPLGREEPIVLLRTCIMPEMTTKIFLPYSS